MSSSFVTTTVISRVLIYRNGTQVLVTRLDPLKEQPQRGSVVRSSDDRLMVAFMEKFDLNEGTWMYVYIFNTFRSIVAGIVHEPRL